MSPKPGKPLPPWAAWPERPVALRQSYEELERYLDFVEERVREWYVGDRDKGFPGLGFVRRVGGGSDGGPADLIFFAPPIEGHKDALAMAFDAVRADARVDLVGFACEAWMSVSQMRDGEQQPDIENLPLPSEAPDRQEAVMIFVAEKVRAANRLLKLVRLENGGVQLERMPDRDLGPGRFLPDLGDDRPNPYRPKPGGR